MFLAFITILFAIVLSKCSSCSKDNREIKEEPITPIASHREIYENNFTIRKREVIYQ